MLGLLTGVGTACTAVACVATASETSSAVCVTIVAVTIVVSSGVTSRMGYTAVQLDLLPPFALQLPLSQSLLCPPLPAGPLTPPPAMLLPPFALKVPGGGGVTISACANAVCAIIETDSIAPAVRIASCDSY